MLSGMIREFELALFSKPFPAPFPFIYGSKSASPVGLIKLVVPWPPMRDPMKATAIIEVRERPALERELPPPMTGATEIPGF